MSQAAGEKGKWMFKVPCPKCAAPVGVKCFVRGTRALAGYCHALRRYAAYAAGLMPEVKIFGLRTKREPYFKRKIPGTGAPHEEGWSSKSCKKGNHAMCFSRQCECFCHQNPSNRVSAPTEVPHND